MTWILLYLINAFVCRYMVTQKKRELLKCVVAAMYSWQHCGTGTLSYRQPRHFSNHGSDLKRQVIMVKFLSIIFFVGFLQFLLGFSKVPVFFVSPVFLRPTPAMAKISLMKMCRPWQVLVLMIDSSWNMMAHSDAREGKWGGNWRTEWVASTLHTTSEHGVSSITTATAYTSAASSRLNWRPPPI